MSHALASASVIGLPNFGASAAKAMPATQETAAAKMMVLSIDMAHRSLGIDGPTRNAVHMLHRERADRRCGARFTALGDELIARRLHIAPFVRGTALQHHRLPVPIPRHAEARQRLGQHRPLHRRQPPALAAIGGGPDLRFAALAAIRTAA